MGWVFRIWVILVARPVCAHLVAVMDGVIPNICRLLGSCRYL